MRASDFQECARVLLRRVSIRRAYYTVYPEQPIRQKVKQRVLNILLSSGANCRKLLAADRWSRIIVQDFVQDFRASNWGPK
jgi:hypothetical protein